MSIDNRANLYGGPRLSDVQALVLLAMWGCPFTLDASTITGSTERTMKSLEKMGLVKLNEHGRWEVTRYGNDIVVKIVDAQGGFECNASGTD